MQHAAYQIKTSHMYQFPDNEFKTPFCRAHSVVQISEKLKSVPCLCQELYNFADTSLTKTIILRQLPQRKSNLY